MTAEQRAAFDRDGYLIIRGALGPDEAAAARDATDRVYTAMAKAGSLCPDGSMHLLSAVTHCPEVACRTDHPATFGHVWSVLGWNIHIYHPTSMSIRRSGYPCRSGSAATKTAAGRTARSRRPRGRGCR
jgi:hypothetical protein